MDELNAQVSGNMAQHLRMLRIQAGLTQAELARMVGTTQSVIARLENTNYDRHSLYTLRRIAAALKRDVLIVFAHQEGGSNKRGGHA